MRISDFQVDVLRDLAFDVHGDARLEAVIVRAFTAEGITGIGDVNSSPHVVRSIVEIDMFFTLFRTVLWANS